MPANASSIVPVIFIGCVVVGSAGLVVVVVALLAAAPDGVVVEVVAGVVAGWAGGVTVRLTMMVARLGSVVTWSRRGLLRMLEDTARDWQTSIIITASGSSSMV